MPRKKVERKVPKIAPLPGYIRTQFIRCGRANCRCRNTNGHGPYYYRVLTVRGKKRKQYVKKAELPAVQAGISERHRQMAEVRQVNQEAQENWRTLKAQIRHLDQLLRLAGYDV